MRGSARRMEVRPASTASLGARSFDISPEDRIGPPLESARARLARRSVMLAAIAAAGWAWFEGHIQMPAGMAEKVIAIVWPTPQKIPSGQSQTPGLPASEQQTRTPDNVAQRLVSEPPGTEAETRLQAPASPHIAAMTKPVEFNGASDTPPSPQKSDEELSAPREPTDPVQKRAAAAGLSPDLSRALLTRLTAVDFENAAAAIRTAVAETPDDGVLVWPKQRKPEQALFKVHFVPGAASPECRRYVVTVVTRDGWTTTAPPMERCGISKGRVSRG